MSAEEVAKRNKRAGGTRSALQPRRTRRSRRAISTRRSPSSTRSSPKSRSARRATSKIGEVNLKKNDLAAAEAAYLKAIEIDPAPAAPYSALADHLQRAEASSTKRPRWAPRPTSCSAPRAPRRSSALFNQGIILWNQGKIRRGQGGVRKGHQGRTPRWPTRTTGSAWPRLNQDKIADAKIAFNEYLKLAPTGQYAATVKAILDTIK